MTPAELALAVRGALEAALADGDLVVTDPVSTVEVRVERPRQKDHGDYATNLALTLAKGAGRPPREVAEVLAAHLSRVPGVARVDVAGPGFLNITLDAAAQGELARVIVGEGARYGSNETLSGRHINLEFVSANPTGPIHLGGTRWAAVGDSLARILAASGAKVAREYYFNDHGAQIDRFARSLAGSRTGCRRPGRRLRGPVHRRHRGARRGRRP